MNANIILNRLPDRVEIGGKEYQIRSDFRTSILFEAMIRSTLNDKEKLIQMLYGSITAEESRRKSNVKKTTPNRSLKDIKLLIALNRTHLIFMPIF